MLSSIIFILIFISAVGMFAFNISKIRRNILLGRDEDRSDRKMLRFKTMLKVAFGQSKMTARPLAAVLHFFIYAGFIIINIEILEIITDGVISTHRVFSNFIPTALYTFLISFFEILALLVAVSCIIFLGRRTIMKLERFSKPEMTRWPLTDAKIILCTEILLMTALFTMNAADSILQQSNVEHYVQVGSFPVSSLLIPMLSGFSTESLILIERSCWWFHIVFILAFMNYVPYSKHLHIFLAFPNTWYSNLNARGGLNTMESVNNEVKAMLDPSFTPPENKAGSFGAKDVRDLTWKQLMDAYSCTECGRCTSECPANITGKKLSPRKIMMDTRDRLEETGRNIDKHGASYNDNKTLFDTISAEEIWACTSCNACVEACPVTIDPLSIIIELRRYLVMEQSAAPSEINTMFSNIENNGAPWKFPPSDRYNWAMES